MPRSRLFVDTSFFIAIMSRKDENHNQALNLLNRYNKAEFWITEAIIVEIGNALSQKNRTGVIDLINSFFNPESNYQIVPVDTELLKRAFDFYSERPDKEWGLTDCISFIVMKDKKLKDALTADHHYEQAGFRPLMLSS